MQPKSKRKIGHVCIRRRKRAHSIRARKMSLRRWKQPQFHKARTMRSQKMDAWLSAVDLVVQTDRMALDRRLLEAILSMHTFKIAKQGRTRQSNCRDDAYNAGAADATREAGVEGDVPVPRPRGWGSAAHKPAQGVALPLLLLRPLQPSS
eukprot:CAMPEP_0179124164 /NCGR_PEP_ID=MMETSP0796-20121207/58666_1 /TAXON_ID=73915 /ORGANISM="Pyrodinium bahamense, Strain pbaha01" /LENGTH=149 /DNA_ID=CAMNT_0020822821 /DNA_START=31 /DNA_END=480 /DNA_ORIENTATION=-